MIINYDRRPDADIDRKIQSLIESIQLALNEKANVIDLEKLEKRIREGGNNGNNND